MRYKLTYRMVHLDKGAAPEGSMGQSIPDLVLGIWSEIVEKDNILQRMKALQIEHNEAIRGGFYRQFPQFVFFWPIQEVV